MSGRVLLIDDISTHRIILKVKLTSAYYDVVQSTSLEDAVLQLSATRPDLILISRRVIKTGLAACLAQLKPGADGPAAPVVVLTENTDDRLRVDALNAGFDDVLNAHAPERYILARLRSLMRQRHHALDLRNQSVAARSLGFAESQQEFTRSARITFVTGDPAAGRALCCVLTTELPHPIDLVDTDGLMSTGRADKLRPDVLIVDLRQMKPEAGLRLVADLRASVSVQETPVLPLVADVAGDLAASLLDMGVCDTLAESASPSEMALRIATQLSHKQASDELRDQIRDSFKAASTDALTGLYNRRHALSYLKCRLSCAEEERGQFAVMVADLDHFKRINDTYGHAGGDAVLARVADTLSAHIGAQGLVARIGGEEFLIILPDTTSIKAHAVAQKLCDAIRRLALRLPGKADPVRVTISIGVTLATPEQVDGPTMDARAAALLEQADRALYTSKAEGRNTVTLADRTAA